MANNNMTAVEWLIEQLKERGYAGQFPPHLLFDHAKQMEKEQRKALEDKIENLEAEMWELSNQSQE